MPDPSQPTAFDIGLPETPVTEYRDAVDWTRYADAYDLLLDHNPAYQALIQDLQAFLDRTDLPDAPEVLDAGGGTGNFSAALLQHQPDAMVCLVEPDPGMRAKAQDKLALYGRAQIASVPFEAYAGDQSYDLIICTHALYTMPSPEARLRQMHDLVKPGGWLFLIDFGRQMRVWDWRLFMMWHLIRKAGFSRAVEIAREGKEIAIQNALVAERQRAGDYWLHTPGELESALTSAGWTVCDRQVVYRGYSTLAICKRT